MGPAAGSALVDLRAARLRRVGPGDLQLREVQPGRVYRSGQMPASALGPDDSRAPDQDGVEPPRAQIPSTAGIAMRSLPRTSRGCDPDRHRHVVLRVDVARPVACADRFARHRRIPVLIHCAWGSERTGPCLGVRRAASPGQHAGRRPRAVFDPPTCSCGSTTAK